MAFPIHSGVSAHYNYAMNNRLFIIIGLTLILFSLVTAASTPTPPSLAPLPLPTGWVKVFDGGFTDTRNTCVSDVMAYMGDIYLATRRSFESPAQNSGAEVLKSADGRNWEVLDTKAIFDQNTIGFQFVPLEDRLLVLPKTWRGDQKAAVIYAQGITALNNQVMQNSDNRFAFGFAFPDQLILGMNNKNGVQIWAGSTEQDLVPVVLNGLGNPNNTSFASNTHKPVIFKGHTYLGVTNTRDGGQLWKSVNGMDWQVVVDGGIDTPLNQSLQPLAIIAGQLFVKASRWSVDGKLSYQLYHSNDGQSWEPVVIEIQNSPLERFASLTLEKLGDEVFLAVISDGLTTSSQASAMVNSFTEGFSLLKTSDGIDWQQVTIAGINKQNIQSAAVSSYGGHLSLMLWDQDKLGQLWLTSDGDNWRKIFESVPQSETAAGIYPFFEKDRLYLAECDTTAGFSLWQYQLDIPGGTSEQEEPSLGIPASGDQQININRVLIALIVISFLAAAWFITKKIGNKFPRS